MFLAPGEFMVLNDTADFHSGCINAVIAATSSGIYEKEFDPDGVTFLCKNQTVIQ